MYDFQYKEILKEIKIRKCQISSAKKITRKGKEDWMVGYSNLKKTNFRIQQPNRVIEKMPYF